MRLRLLFLGLVGAFSIVASSAMAVTYERRTTADGTRFVVVKGDFVNDDRLDDFVLAVRDHNASFVTFDSPGGDVDAAIRLGRMLRILGKDTIQTREMRCESACSLAFLGGVKRMAEPGSIGVHRIYFEDSYAGSRDQAVVEMQKNTALILGYLRAVGVDAELLEISYWYDRGDMRFLSGAEMTRMRVTTQEFTYDVAALDAAPAAAAVLHAPPADLQPADAPPAEAVAVATPPNAEQAALKLVEDIVAAHGMTASTAISRVTDSYAGNVEYYGKRASLGDVLREKQSYFQRWPQRDYRIRQDSLGVICEAAVCEVMGIYDWAVRNSDDTQKFAGVAWFHYDVDMTSMRIVAERSEIVDR